MTGVRRARPEESCRKQDGAGDPSHSRPHKRVRSRKRIECHAATTESVQDGGVYHPVRGCDFGQQFEQDLRNVFTHVAGRVGGVDSVRTEARARITWRRFTIRGRCFDESLSTRTACAVQPGPVVEIPPALSFHRSRLNFGSNTRRSIRSRSSGTGPQLAARTQDLCPRCIRITRRRGSR